MYVSVEISYYPLVSDFQEPVNRFIEKLKNKNVEIEAGAMSTVITGEYNKIMDILSLEMGELMKEYPSVFTLKISNSCRM